LIRQLRLMETKEGTAPLLVLPYFQPSNEI
jgi:hypothetical protein